MGVIMIEMKEDPDGVFRERGPDTALPYGLPEDPQEPYVAIVAPNIDKISAGAFDTRTLAGRRTVRGLIVFASTVVGAGALIGVVIAAQWALGLFGVE